MQPLRVFAFSWRHVSAMKAVSKVLRVADPSYGGPPSWTAASWITQARAYPRAPSPCPNLSWKAVVLLMCSRYHPTQRRLCRYWGVAEDASGQKNLICSSRLPFNYGNPVPEMTSSNFEVEKEYPRIDDGILELKWNLKISPEFKYNLLVLSTKH